MLLGSRQSTCFSGFCGSYLSEPSDVLGNFSWLQGPANVVRAELARGRLPLALGDSLHRQNGTSCQKDRFPNHRIPRHLFRERQRRLHAKRIAVLYNGPGQDHIKLQASRYPACHWILTGHPLETWTLDKSRHAVDSRRLTAAG